VQGLALTPSILATRSVVSNPESTSLLKASGLIPAARQHALRGIASEVPIYEIP
jgi:hypothetical protein